MYSKTIEASNITLHIANNAVSLSGVQGAVAIETADLTEVIRILMAARDLASATG